MAEAKNKNVLGKFDKILPILLPPDEDLISSIKQACQDNGIRSGTILTAVGSLQKANYQSGHKALLIPITTP